MARNQFAIRLGQLLVGVLGIGSLLLLSKVWEKIGIVVHSPPRHMSLYAFALSSGCIMFFAVRAEIRWRKSSGLDRTSTSPGSTRGLPMTRAVRRTFLGILLIGLLSLCFSVGFLAQWPRPASLYMGAASWLCWFAILVLLVTIARDRANALQLQRFMLVAFACVEIAMLALFWRFRDGSPALSSAALIAAAMLCVGVTAAISAIRWIMPRS